MCKLEVLFAPQILIRVALGGACGALLRLGFSGLLRDENETVAVFILNIIGSAFLGVLVSQRSRLSEGTFHLLGAGIAGGTTTLSTFALAVASQIDAGAVLDAAIHAGSTIVATLIFAGIGYRIGRDILGPTKPSEGHL